MRLRTSVGVRYGLLYLVVSLASSWPIFLGYVPLPVEFITGAPLWGPIQGSVTYRQFGVMEDLVRSFYPGHRLIGEAIRSGTIPLWNPYVLNGYPMHAALASKNPRRKSASDQRADFSTLSPRGRPVVQWST